MHNRLPFALLMVFASAASTSSQQAAEGSGSYEAAPQVRRSLPVAPLQGFVANHGQWPTDVLFFARLGGIDATIVRDALVLRPAPDPETGRWPAPLVLHFPAARSVEGKGILPTAHHFITAEGSASNVPGFQQVVLREVAPGIDMVVRKGADSFAYDVHVAAGADLKDLVIEVEGAQGAEVIDDGVISMQAAAGRVEQRIGAAWETDPETGGRAPVVSAFRKLEESGGRLRFGFEATDRDPLRPFVLDPSLVFATYVGGPSQELIEGMDVDAKGNVYLVAKASPGTPTTPGAFDETLSGSSDAWAGKLSADGTTLEWGTFVGGSAAETPVSCNLDGDGTLVVCGDTFSNDFPTTPGSLQPVFAGGNNDNFATRLAPDGSALVWSTYYGGSSFEISSSAALLPFGDVVIAAEPHTASPPATAGAFDTVFEPGKQTLVRISADGSSLVFRTYFKASSITSIVASEASAIYFGGSVSAADAPLPATPGAFKTTMVLGDSKNGFVAKIDSSGSQVVWATYLGGDDASDGVLGMAVDAASAVYAVGLTSSRDFPVTVGAFASAMPGTDSGFVTKLLPGGTGVVWSTYIGACCGGGSLLSDIRVDLAGSAVVVGDSNEPNFPTTPDAFQPAYVGSFPSSDAHLTKFDVFGEALVYSTYFGGGQTDYLSQVQLDAEQDPYLVVVAGTGVPVTPGAYDTTNAGGGDLVVAKFDLSELPWEVLAGGLKGGLDTPNLAGRGAMTPGSPGRFSVRGAKPLAAATLVVGLSVANLPLKGGTLVPFPTVLITLGTNAQGALDLPFTWVNVPAGIAIYSQFWIKDQQAATGFSATNALKMTSQ